MVPRFHDNGTGWWKGCQPYAPATFIPRKYTWYSFLLEAELTPGPQCDRKDYVTTSLQVFIKIINDNMFVAQYKSSLCKTQSLLCCHLNAYVSLGKTNTVHFQFVFKKTSIL